MSKSAHRLRRSALVGAASLLLGAGAALTYWTLQVRRSAKGNTDAFLKQGRAPGQRVVVCLGASIVHGRVSVDFVDLLRGRFPSGEYVFVNAGVNGDLAYNALQRLGSVVACDPDAVVVLVGTNDVQSTLSRRIGLLSIVGKHLPQRPTIQWYRVSLGEIVSRLRRKTRARVGLCSLPVLGEDLASTANRRVEEFNAVIRKVAAETGAAYLPVHERQVEYLRSVGGAQGPAYADSPLLVVVASMQRYLLGLSLDEISRRNGLVLTTDCIHMNSLGADLIAQEVEAFLSATGD